MVGGVRRMIIVRGPSWGHTPRSSRSL